MDYKKKIHITVHHIYSVLTIPHKQVRFIGVARKYHKCFMVYIITDKVVKLLLLFVEILKPKL